MNNDDIAYVEVRGAAGGDEAKIWAKELLRMYARYATKRGWQADQLDEGTLAITGEGSFGLLKNESGVHRVQRVPETEKRGRVHTSTATVAVLPRIPENEIEINPKDLDIQFFRAQGAGGQNVNKVNTAVRIIHRSTGIAVGAQTERSQAQNRANAMTILRSKLWERQQALRQNQMADYRSAIGGGDRAEKIRTYNFPQNRVTDHRIGKSFHNLEDIIDGDLEKVIEKTRGLL